MSIQGHRSCEIVKNCDVPQGSVLGPNLYEDYTAPPVVQIFRKHNINFMIYVDDTQAYVSCDTENVAKTLIRLQNYLEDIRQWMAKD